MKTIVVGPYPTMPGPEAAATFALVRDLVRAGDDVTVVSPEPSAAHVHLDPGGARGAARLARLVRGAGKLVIRLDAAALAAGRDPRPAFPGRVALGAALRRVPEVEIHLDRVPDRLTPQFVGLVLEPATRVVVASDEEKAALQRSGVATAKVTVQPLPAPAEPLGARHADVPAPDHVSARDLQTLVRSRAASYREATARAERAGTGEASRALRHLPPLEAAPVRSGKPGVAVVKRVQRRLLGWQFDSVIQHVNRLHRATIEAVDALESEASPQDRHRAS